MGAAATLACGRIGIDCLQGRQQAQISGRGCDGRRLRQGHSADRCPRKKRSLKDFSGKVVAVFFGYTQCPDVCPTTLQELLEVKQALGADGDKLQAVFVSLDPERDTPRCSRPIWPTSTRALWG
jgi:protein SCO1/2